MGKGCVVEFENDSNFVLKKIYNDTLIEPLPKTDLNNDSHLEINFSGGEVGAETIADLDKDGNMDLLFVGDDTLDPAGKKKIFIAEYNQEINNFEEKFRHFPEDFTTYGFSHGDFDSDGFSEFVTGSIHWYVYIFENSGNDSYNLIAEDTLSTSNAYLTVAINDLDNNGKTEFIVGGSSFFNGIGGTRFYWFEADRDNKYKKVRSFFLLGIDPLSWDEIHIFDVNDDGKDDIHINYTYAVVILTWDNDSREFRVLYLSIWDKPVHGVTMYDPDKDNKLDFFISVKENENIPAFRTYYFNQNIIISIQEPEKSIVYTFILSQNFPNPFNNSTSIPFSTTSVETITITIYNPNGNEAKKLIKNKLYQSGKHSVKWDGTDNRGKEVSSGLYFMVLSNGKQKLSRKMLLLK